MIEPAYCEWCNREIDYETHPQYLPVGVCSDCWEEMVGQLEMRFGNQDRTGAMLE
jgi:hypothetical protein